MELGGNLENVLDAGPLQRAHEEQGREADVLQVTLRLVAQAARFAFLVLHQVPLVDGQDDRAPALLGLCGDASVLVDAELRRVREHDHHVGVFHRAQRPLRREHFHLVDHVPLLAQSRGVGEHVPPALPDQLLIHGIPRRPWRRGRHEALLAKEPVQERALADVRPAQDRQTDGLLRFPGILARRFR